MCIKITLYVNFRKTCYRNISLFVDTYFVLVINYINHYEYY